MVSTLMLQHSFLEDYIINCQCWKKIYEPKVPARVQGVNNNFLNERPPDITLVQEYKPKLHICTDCVKKSYYYIILPKLPYQV